MSSKRAKGARAPVEVEMSARERILAEAERIFGAQGFDGTSLRQLAVASSVPLALISYHFGSKEGICRAVITLRAPTVIDQGIAGLVIAASERDPTVGSSLS